MKYIDDRGNFINFNNQDWSINLVFTKVKKIVLSNNKNFNDYKDGSSFIQNLPIDNYSSLANTQNINVNTNENINSNQINDLNSDLLLSR